MTPRTREHWDRASEAERTAFVLRCDAATAVVASAFREGCSIAELAVGLRLTPNAVEEALRRTLQARE